MKINLGIEKLTAGIGRVMGGHKKVVVIAQCRLSSTRLPGKALLPLGDKAVLDWTLEAMKRVKADDYWLAVDHESKTALSPHAEKYGWKIFAGSLEDVLERFCGAIKESGADVVVRATADNPFLFYDAANEMIEEYFNREKSSPVDYLTYSGLPHGSGVEMFNAHSLLKAAELTSSPYDHEHVGPSLYLHTDRFQCAFVKAPEKYHHPNMRTTIDTPEDYRRAMSVVRSLSQKGANGPYSTEDIVGTCSLPQIKNPVLLVPSVKKGHGTGHLRRCLDLAIENKWDVYIPDDCDLEEAGALVAEAGQSGLDEFHVVKNLSSLSYYSCAITDMFVSDENLKKTLSQNVAVIALDEGSPDLDFADYVFDVIPGLDEKKQVNLCDPTYLPMPENKRSVINSNEDTVSNALVVLGGEDPAGLAVPAAKVLASMGIKTTAIVPDPKKCKAVDGCTFIGPVKNLREKLADYDLVVTHYGFTAFEARHAGCKVILLGTTPLHERLSRRWGFECIRSSAISAESFACLFADPSKLVFKTDGKGKSLADALGILSSGNHFDCPVCRKPHAMNPVVARTSERTFRRCGDCGMLYMSWTVKETQTEYNRAYFFEDYEKQYGKTYLDDFSSIKNQCLRRMKNIIQVSGNSRNGTVIDVGCAMGPFLSAAADCGWQPFGTDISKDAVDYVTGTLNFPACCGAFPNVDLFAELGQDKFDAVTMWYVIEHFLDLDSVLNKISELVAANGIFAFSTPCGSGVSARFSRQSFFEQSPSDHYTIWEKNGASRVLGKYGFKIMKVVPTGIHPERLPIAKKFGWKKDSLQMKILAWGMKMLKMGDTFEIYCKKSR